MSEKIVLSALLKIEVEKRPCDDFLSFSDYFESNCLKSITFNLEIKTYRLNKLN